MWCDAFTIFYISVTSDAESNTLDETTSDPVRNRIEYRASLFSLKSQETSGSQLLVVSMLLHFKRFQLWTPSRLLIKNDIDSNILFRIIKNRTAVTQDDEYYKME